MDRSEKFIKSESTKEEEKALLSEEFPDELREIHAEEKRHLSTILGREALEILEQNKATIFSQQDFETLDGFPGMYFFKFGNRVVVLEAYGDSEDIPNEVKIDFVFSDELLDYIVSSESDNITSLLTKKHELQSDTLSFLRFVKQFTLSIDKNTQVYVIPYDEQRARVYSMAFNKSDLNNQNIHVDLSRYPDLVK